MDMLCTCSKYYKCKLWATNFVNLLLITDSFPIGVSTDSCPVGALWLRE